MKHVKGFESFRQLKESLDHTEVLQILDAAAMFADDAEVAANQTWRDREDLIKYLLSDHIAKKDHKKFLKYVGESEVNEASAERIDAQLDKMRKLSSKIAEEIATSRKDKRSKQDYLADLAEKLDKAETSYNNEDDESRYDFWEEKIEGLQDKMGEVEGKIDEISDRIEALQAKAQEVDDKMRDLREKKSSMSESICEATVEMDAMDPDDKDFLKFLKKNGVKIIKKEKGGPGGGTPVITMQGKRKDLEKVLADDEFGWADPDLAEYIEESVTINENKYAKAGNLGYNDQFLDRRKSLSKTLSLDLGLNPKDEFTGPWLGFDYVTLYAVGPGNVGGTILGDALTGKYSYDDLKAAAAKYLKSKKVAISESLEMSIDEATDSEMRASIRAAQDRATQLRDKETELRDKMQAEDEKGNEFEARMARMNLEKNELQQRIAQLDIEQLQAKYRRNNE